MGGIESVRHRPIVIIESPYRGANAEERARNTLYVRLCLRDSLLKGEAPFASHAIYTLPGVLDEDTPEERKAGIEAGYSFWTRNTRIVFYTDCGWSPGMLAALERAVGGGFSHEKRTLEGWQK